MVTSKFYFLKIVDDDLMNEVASKPSTLQPYVMETTEVQKKNWKMKIAHLAGNFLRNYQFHIQKSIPYTVSNPKQ
jgi:hypothetical protein